MDSMSKPLHAGHAAEAGLLAALAAREGVTGSLDVIEGEAGFGRAMSDGPDWDKALATLGRDFHITRMTFKNHACCGHTFAAIDGALELQRSLGVARADIARVARRHLPRRRWRSPATSDPATPAEARFSLKYVVATALTHGSVRLAAFEPARLADPATRGADAARSTVASIPNSTRAFPASAPRASRSRRATAAAASICSPRARAIRTCRSATPSWRRSSSSWPRRCIGDAAARALLARLWTLERESPSV